MLTIIFIPSGKDTFHEPQVSLSMGDVFPVSMYLLLQLDRCDSRSNAHESLGG